MSTFSSHVDVTGGTAIPAAMLPLIVLNCVLSGVGGCGGLIRFGVSDCIFGANAIGGCCIGP